MVVFRRKFDVREIKLLLFDLDGTLIDSRVDLADSVNAVLRYFGRSELPTDVIASYVGDGATMLVHRALGDGEPAILQEGLQHFLAHYSIHRLDHTRPYAGVPEMLAAARGTSEQPRQLSVLSNKPAELSRAIVDGLGLAPFFASVYGGDSFATRKPDPLGARNIMAKAGISADHSLIVGDSANDILTGRNAGTWTCGVTYGFAPHTLGEARADVVVDTTDELKALFEEFSCSVAG